MCPFYEVMPSRGSIEAQKFGTASGKLIENLGQQMLDVMTDEGIEVQIPYQSAHVQRQLNSVSEICDGGGEDGPHVMCSK